MKISAKDKKLLIVLLIIVIAALIFMLGIRPLSATVTEQQAKIDELKLNDETYQKSMAGSNTYVIDLETAKRLNAAAYEQIPGPCTELEARSRIIKKLKELEGSINLNLPDGEIKPVKGMEGVNLDEKTRVDLYYWSMPVDFECTTTDTIKIFVTSMQNGIEWNVKNVSAKFEDIWKVQATIIMYFRDEQVKK